MANQKYSNFVLEEKVESILDTKVDLNNYVTRDDSLTENPGMIKKIHKYHAEGSMEELAMTQGNSSDYESKFTEESYTVGVTQGRGTWYDEEEWTDPMVVDTIVKGMAEDMVNDFTKKAIAEMKKADNIIECDFSTTTDGYLFNKIVDALAIVNNENESEDGYTLLISPNNQAYIRKMLRNDLNYSEGYVRTGYIGSVAGIPVVMSKAVPDNCAFVVNRKAITLFNKRGVHVEQERDADHRKNQMWIRKVALVALTNSNYLVELAKAQSTACAITTYTKSAKTIAGSCSTDAYKVVVVDGDDEVYEVTPSNGSWTMSAKENLTAGDKINATAYAYGFVPYKATEVTVAS